MTFSSRKIFHMVRVLAAEVLTSWDTDEGRMWATNRALIDLTQQVCSRNMGRHLFQETLDQQGGS